MKILTLLLLYSFTLVPSIGATTYWASVAGGAASCAAASGGSDPGQYRTIAQGVSCLVAGNGDTLILKAGTYTNTQLLIPSGTALAKTTIRSDSTGTVVFTGTPAFDLYSNSTSYVDFIGNRTTLNLTWDGTGQSDASAFSICQTSRKPDCPGENHNITFDGVRVHHWEGNGIYLYSADNTFKYSRFDNNGTVLVGGNVGYAFYISGGSNNNVVEYSEIDHQGGYGIHIYSGYAEASTNNTIRFNRIHDNGQTASPNNAFGILLSGGGNGGAPGTGNAAYSNVIYGERDGGIVVNYACTTCLVYNNTIYGSTGSGILIEAVASGTLITNNIVSNNSTNIADLSANSTFTTNLCSIANIGKCALVENAAATFNEPSLSNFTLKSGSLAINAGTNLAAPYNTSIDGTTRPSGAFDLGAYETSMTAPACPATAPQLVASYPFNGVATNAVGNTVGAATLGTGVTYSGGGITFTGAGGATVADNDALDFCGGFTLMAKVNLPDTLGNYALIAKNPDSKAFLFASIQEYCGTAGAGVPMGGFTQDPIQPVACYATPLSTGTFHHLAVTYDSTFPVSSVKLYLNGALVATGDGTSLLDATTGSLQFCTSGFTENCPSGTILKDVKIYNYPRSAAEIVTDMATMTRTVKVSAGQTLKLGMQ